MYSVLFAIFNLPYLFHILLYFIHKCSNKAPCARACVLYVVAMETCKLSAAAVSRVASPQKQELRKVQEKWGRKKHGRGFSSGLTSSAPADGRGVRRSLSSDFEALSSSRLGGGGRIWGKMTLEDPRVEWLRDRVCSCLSLPGPDCFTELLNRGQDQQKILQFLNQVSDQEEPSALLFFKHIRQEEVEEEVPNGKPVRTVCCLFLYN